MLSINLIQESEHLRTKTEMALRNLLFILQENKGSLQAKRGVQLKQHGFPEKRQHSFFFPGKITRNHLTIAMAKSLFLKYLTTSSNRNRTNCKAN